MKQWFKVTVNYKSGVTVEFVVDDFHFEKNGSYRKVTWGNVKRGSKRPLWFNIDDVESLWSQEL